MEIVPNFFISIPLIVLKDCFQLLPMPTCLCLQYFISVREKVFISVCDCGITHVYGKLVCINSDDNQEVIGEQL